MSADLSSGTISSGSDWSFSLQGGESAMVTNDITSATVAWSVAALGGANTVPVFDASGSAVSLTSDQSISVQGPGTFTASVTGGGSAQFEVSKYSIARA